MAVGGAHNALNVSKQQLTLAYPVLLQLLLYVGCTYLVNLLSGIAVPLINHKNIHASLHQHSNAILSFIASFQVFVLRKGEINTKINVDKRMKKKTVGRGLSRD